MSEHLAPHSGERHQPIHEAAPRPEHHKPDHEKIAHAEKQQSAVLKEMEKLSEELAHSAEDMQLKAQGENKPQQSHTFGVHKELKLENYKRILSSVQSRLKGPEKTFSKAIHNKQVDAISSAGAKTVARPVGILVGGAAAFIGSLVVLMFARRYGFTYNFFMFGLLFVGGYLVGTLAEALANTSKRIRH
jgi:preprotein translocase subunit SecF